MSDRESLDVNSAPAGSVSQLLRAWGDGDAHARDELLPLVYQELRRRAAAYIRRERPDHTLQPTALVHEAYLRLRGQTRVSRFNRAQFFALASQLMRRILVDYARERQAAKRGAGIRVTFDERLPAVAPLDCEVLMLDEALRDLAKLDSRQAEIVELKYFAGLSETEIAVALSLSRATVTREWQSARAWLHRRIKQGRSEGA